MTYLLEMEDVLCELTAEVAKAHEIPNSISTKGELLGISQKEIEIFLEKQPVDFWKSLKPTPELSEIREKLKNKKVKVVTRPYNLNTSQEGKKQWLAEHFPEADVLFTRSKHVFANSESSLIDCKPAAIQAFRRYGGKSVLIPKPWHKNYKPAAKIPDLENDSTN